MNTSEVQTVIEGIATGKAFREGTLMGRTFTEDRTKDFSTAQSLTEDVREFKTQEDEIIIKCSLEQVVKGFFQDYVIVWHHPNLSSQKNQQYFVQLKKFCEVFTLARGQQFYPIDPGSLSCNHFRNKWGPTCQRD